MGNDIFNDALGLEDFVWFIILGILALFVLLLLVCCCICVKRAKRKGRDEAMSQIQEQEQIVAINASGRYIQSQPQAQQQQHFQQQQFQQQPQQLPPPQQQTNDQFAYRQVTSPTRSDSSSMRQSTSESTSLMNRIQELRQRTSTTSESFSPPVVPADPAKTKAIPEPIPPIAVLNEQRNSIELHRNSFHKPNCHVQQPVYQVEPYEDSYADHVTEVNSLISAAPTGFAVATAIGDATADAAEVASEFEHEEDTDSNEGRATTGSLGPLHDNSDQSLLQEANNTRVDSRLSGQFSDPGTAGAEEDEFEEKDGRVSSELSSELDLDTSITSQTSHISVEF